MPRHEAIVSATPQEVWELYTTDAVGDWLWPDAPSRELHTDLRTGGEWAFGQPGSPYSITGKYLDYSPFERLHFTWAMDGSFVEDEMELLFTPVSGGCRITLSYPESPAAEEDSRRAVEMLTALQQALAGRATAR